MPGTVQFNNSTDSTIPITILDDLQIDDPKALILDLEFDEFLGYAVGTKFRHMIMLYDNRGYWSGVLENDDVEAGFRVACCARAPQWILRSLQVKPTLHTRRAASQIAQVENGR